MHEKKKRQLEARAQIMKALAHPTRLFVVDELSKGERCVCELTDMIGADISTVSKHLSVLKQAGIVQDEKRGQRSSLARRASIRSYIFAITVSAKRLTASVLNSSSESNPCP